MMTAEEKIEFLRKQGILVDEIGKNKEPTLMYTSEKAIEMFHESNKLIWLAKEEVLVDLQRAIEELKRKHLRPITAKDTPSDKVTKEWSNERY